jgi:hypothetical protein
VKFLSGIFEKIICIAAMIVLCQFPSFMEQYTMRVAGHLAECSRFVKTLEKNASLSKRTMSDYIQKFLAASDEDFRSAGEMMDAVIERQKWLNDTLTKLIQATPFTRPFVFVGGLDSEIVQETVNGYKVQFVFTWETLIYALIGLFLGMGIWRGITSIFKKTPPPATGK